MEEKERRKGGREREERAQLFFKILSQPTPTPFLYPTNDYTNYIPSYTILSKGPLPTGPGRILLPHALIHPNAYLPIIINYLYVKNCLMCDFIMCDFIIY